MKAHLAKVSLALLSAAFLLGCQEQGSQPVGPEGPQFDKPGTPGAQCPGGGDQEVRDSKGHCHGDDEPTEDATFTATFGALCPDKTNLCDVIGVADPLFGPSSGKEILTGGGVLGDDIPLAFSAFLETPESGYSDEDGANCFGDLVFTGIISIGKDTPNSNEAKIGYWFTGKDKLTGETDVTYSFSMSGVLIPEKWPPTLDNPTTIDGSSGTFRVGNNNSPADLACRGTGSVNFFVDVVLNGTDPA